MSGIATSAAGGTRAQGLACVECRRMKMKCLGNEGGTTPCQRCKKLDLACDYARARRGPKPRHRSPSTTNREARSHSSSSPKQESSSRSIPQDSSIGGSRLPARHSPRALPPGVSTIRKGHEKDVDMVVRLNPDVDPHETTLFPARNQREVPIWSSEMGPTIEESEMEAQNASDDPISLGYTTLGDADMLVKLFHEHLNPLIAILDPVLHTTAYLRSTCLPLLTAVLAVSSKFFHDRITASLLAHARALLSRNIDRGVCETGIIQAILILVYWKEPTDMSAWIKIGVAIRMAYQMGWHEQRVEKLSADVSEARKDSERAWYCFDRQYADIFGLPPTIQLTDTFDCEAWATDHLHLGISVDLHLACSIDSREARRFWTRLRRGHTGASRQLRAVLLDDLYQSVNRHEAKWFGERSSISPPLAPREKNLLHWFALSSLLGIKHEQLALTAAVDVDVGVSECLEHATRVVHQLEIVSKDGLLRYLYDAGSCTLSNFGVIMYQLRRRLSTRQQEYICSLMERTRACCLAAELRHRETPMTLCARFFGRLLHILQGTSDGAREAVQAGPPSLPTVQPNDPILDFDAEEFLRNTLGAQYDQLFQSEEDWSYLFSVPVA